ncbi:MAG: LysR substrate-binding domain-containing protein [Geminicoccaceae bacterium]
MSEAGRRLLPHARRILRVQQEALAAFGDPCATGTIRLGAHDEYVSGYLPQILRRFAKAYPGITVELISDTSPELGKRMANGELDLMITTDNEAGPGGVVLYREQAVWVSSARHDVHLEDPVPLALYHEGCWYRRWGTNLLEQRGRDYRVAYVILSLTSVDAVVRAGLAVAIMNRGSVRPEYRVLTEEDGFPALPNFDIKLQRRAHGDPDLLDRLEAHIVESFRGPIELIAA